MELFTDPATWMSLVTLTALFFSLLGHAFSGRDVILLGGGPLLLGKATHEIHENLEVVHFVRR